MNKDKLLPCPFCGGEDIAIIGSEDIYFLYCRNCCAGAHTDTTKEDAINRWNTRNGKLMEVDK